MSVASTIAIVGDLTMSRVVDAMKRVTSVSKNQDIRIDLAGVTDADSSAVAFLLNCQRLARERGANVEFIAVPECIMTLADIYGLKSVIIDATPQA